MRHLVLAIGSFIGTTALAQDIAPAPPTDPGHPHAAFKFILNLDAREQVVLGSPMKFFGLRLGALKGHNIVALGVYGLDDPFLDTGVPALELHRDSVDLRTSFSYLSLTYERIVLDTKRWQLSVPVMLGHGNVRVEYRDTADVFEAYARREVVPLESGVRAAYKLFFWLYLQGGVGYRRVLTTDLRVNNVYSGFVWSSGISIKLGKIYNYARERLKERQERRSLEHGTE